MLLIMNQSGAMSNLADNIFLQKFEELFELNQTGEITITDYLHSLDKLDIPKEISLPLTFDEFRTRVERLLDNKSTNGFHNAEINLMHTEINNFYKFIEGVKKSQPVVEITTLVRLILEYLQDTPISHLPEFLFTALTGSNNRAFATAVVRRFDMPL